MVTVVVYSSPFIRIHLFGAQILEIVFIKNYISNARLTLLVVFHSTLECLRVQYGR